MSLATLVTTCMNRNEYLNQVIPTWLACPTIGEIIVVDYSSKEKCKPIVDKYQNGKIIYIEVPNQQYFNLSKARNVAIKCITSPYTCMIDADIKIIKPLDKALFDGEVRSGQRCGNGSVIAPTEAFTQINGYNEYMNGYGQEDWDVYTRMRELGYKFTHGGLNDYIHHINHPTSLRSQNYIIKDIRKSLTMNRRIGREHKWGIHRIMVDLKETILYPSISKNITRIHSATKIDATPKLSASLCIVPADVEGDLSVTLTSWLKYDIFDRIIIVNSPKDAVTSQVVNKYQNGKIFLVQSPNGKIFNDARCRNIALSFVPSSSKFAVFANKGTCLTDSLKKIISNTSENEISYNGDVEVLSCRVISRCGKYNETVNDSITSRSEFNSKIRKSGFNIKDSLYGSKTKRITVNTNRKFDSTKEIEVTIPNQGVRILKIP